jgi:hypothetical protein
MGWPDAYEPEPPAETKPAEAKEAPPAPPADPAAEVLRRAVHLMAESKGEPWVNKANVWPMIKRPDPTVDPKNLGHASFGEMLKALDKVVEVRKGDADHQLRLES